MTTPYIPPHVQDLLKHLQTLPIQPPPPPWQRIETFAVGGLLAVGYAEPSDLLLGISTAGRAVFDCQSGARIARDRSAAEQYYDEIALTAQGFGPLEGHILRIAGMWGGGLPIATRDAW